MSNFDTKIEEEGGWTFPVNSGDSKLLLWQHWLGTELYPTTQTAYVHKSCWVESVEPWILSHETYFLQHLHPPTASTGRVLLRLVTRTARQRLMALCFQLYRPKHGQLQSNTLVMQGIMYEANWSLSQINPGRGIQYPDLRWRVLNQREGFNKNRLLCWLLDFDSLITELCDLLFLNSGPLLRITERYYGGEFQP